MKRILVAVDFSELSDRALDHAVALAKSSAATIEIVHVAAAPVTVLPPPLEVAPLTSATAAANEALAIEDELERRAERVRARGITCSTQTLVGGLGDTAAQIQARATETGADLIVMATHGRTGWRHAVLGSVAERLLRTARVPVLVVPPVPAAT